MNLQDKKNIIVIMGIALLFAVIGFLGYFFGKIEGAKEPYLLGGLSVATNTPPYVSKQSDTREYTGVISPSTEKLNLYTAKRYGLQFLYPKEWRVKDNFFGRLGNNSPGQIIFSNYPESEEYSSVPTETNGKNSILIQTYSDNIYATSTGGYNDSKIVKKQVMIAGRPVTKFEIEGEALTGVHGQVTYFGKGGIYHVLVYFIPIPNSGNYLRFSIYGDPSNFHVLDEIVQSLVFI
ncbi:MAG: hypothetical protein ACYC8S_02095 [Minisyncoccota bacterium]